MRLASQRYSEADGDQTELSQKSIFNELKNPKIYDSRMVI